MNGLRFYREPSRPFFFEAPVSTGFTLVQPGVRMLKHSYVNSGRINSGVYIGRYCSIGNGVTLGTGHHDYTQLSTSSWFNVSAPPSFRSAEPGVHVRIKNDVWIGDEVVVLTGVTIGNGAIIGAGAVVTKDVPDYAIVVGVPAKVLRYRFDESTIDRLQKLKWWELDDQVLKQHSLQNVHESLDYLEALSASARTSITPLVVKY